jgi:hypothetical protein
MNLFRQPRRLQNWAIVVGALFVAATARAQEAAAPTATVDAAGAAAAGQRVFSEDIQKIIATGREKNQAMAHLNYLTNHIGPRLTGSDGLANASEWTRERFESFGLENAHLDKFAEWPVGFNRGPWFGRMITPEELDLEFATDAWTAGTKGKQRGPAILAPTNDAELEAVKEKLPGSWVLSASAGGRGGRRGRGQAERPEGQRGGGPRLPQPGDNAANESATAQQSDIQDSANQRRTESAGRDDSDQSEGRRNVDGQRSDNNRRNDQPSAQQDDNQRGDNQRTDNQTGDNQPSGDQPREGRRGGRRGRRGRGQFDDPFRQKLQAAYREAGILGTIARRNNDILVTGGRRPTTAEFMDNLPTQPQINMTATSFDAVGKHVRAGEEVVLEFDIRNYFKKGPIPIYNVIADIPGNELPDEYVIVGGHIDSWDGATGATDNGTGVASALEAARILKAAGVQPKRTIRFMLWSGEEQGLLGSRAYVQANPDLMKRISAVLVHDLGTQYLSSISGLSYQLPDLNEVFAPVMSLDPSFPFHVRSTDDLRSLGSDHRSFVNAGVPGFFWGQSGGGFNYWDSHHSQHDTFDKAVAEYQEHSSIVIALAAYGIANLDHMLPRQGKEIDGENGDNR